MVLLLGGSHDSVLFPVDHLVEYLDLVGEPAGDLHAGRIYLLPAHVVWYMDEHIAAVDVHVDFELLVVGEVEVGVTLVLFPLSQPPRLLLLLPQSLGPAVIYIPYLAADFCFRVFLLLFCLTCWWKWWPMSTF